MPAIYCRISLLLYEPYANVSSQICPFLASLPLPLFYPPALGLPGFAQDNCIPEIVTLKFSPVTPPPPLDGASPIGWGEADEVGVTFYYNFSRQNFFINFLGSSWNFPHFWNFDPQPPRGGVGQKKCIDFLDTSWHFPDFWFLWPPKIHTSTTLGLFFLGRNHPQVYPHACQIWSWSVR